MATALGRSGLIAPNFGGPLEEAELYSAPKFWTDRSRTSWIKTLAEFQSLGSLFMDLEMPEIVGSTQRLGEYCRKVPRWILCTLNGEILPINDLPPGFSGANAVAGGIFDRNTGFFAARSDPMAL